jgi:hypothetical protein
MLCLKTAAQELSTSNKFPRSTATSELLHKVIPSFCGLLSRKRVWCARRRGLDQVTDAWNCATNMEI